MIAQSNEIQFLSGTGADKTVNWEFFCSEGMNSGKWTTIAVPSCWEQQGFGAYNYGHDKFENRLNETGTYFESDPNTDDIKQNLVLFMQEENSLYGLACNCPTLQRKDENKKLLIGGTYYDNCLVI